MKLLLVFLCLLIAGCDLTPETRLERVQNTGVLQVLTRNGGTTYYEGPFGPAGIEYELVAGFARYLGVKLELKVPDTLAQVLADIASGKADLAAAGLTVTEGRRRVLNFSDSYQQIIPQLVYRAGTDSPADLDGLHGSFEVMADSSHAERLRALRQDYPGLTFEENGALESAELLNLVWEQVIDYTVADSNEVAISRRFYPELRIAFGISDPEPLAWAFPPGDDRSLVEKANKYLQNLRDSGRLDQLLEKYYAYVAEFDYVGTRRYMQHIEQRLPLYQAWFEEAGKSTGTDWRLLAAIGYQESHWNPKAISPTGVRGLMMLTRDTMRHLGIEESRHDPKASIEGGARYIQRVKKRLPKRIKDPARTWMALAAYNIGYGHLEDARILAERDGADPDRWMEVKKYLPLLSQKKWYKDTRHGYARGHEPVRYVENIRTYYDILVWLTDHQQPPRAPVPALTIQSPAL
jgi:membrane-bound lytic murein transglycosylase F